MFENVEGPCDDQMMLHCCARIRTRCGARELLASHNTGGTSTSSRSEKPHTAALLLLYIRLLAFYPHVYQLHAGFTQAVLGFAGSG